MLQWVQTIVSGFGSNGLDFDSFMPHNCKECDLKAQEWGSLLDVLSVVKTIKN